MAAIAGVSLLVHGGMLNPYLVLFRVKEIFTFPFPQIWRLFTPFLLTGGGFNALWDLYMFWTYVTQLEQNSPRFTQPGDFATYVAFIAATIMVSLFYFRSLSHKTSSSARSDLNVFLGSC